MERYILFVVSIFVLSCIGTLVMADNLQNIDPSTILYSAPTIPNQLPPLEQFSDKKDTAIFPIHEDNWSSIEFLNRNQLEKLKEVMTEYHKFEAQNRRDIGWKNVYLRHTEHSSLLEDRRPKHKLLHLLSANEGNRPIIYSSNKVVGLIENGFTVLLGRDVFLYGYTKGSSIIELGVHLGKDPENQSLVSAFSILNKELGLLLVDWHSQFILTGINASGQVEMWSPQ